MRSLFLCWRVAHLLVDEALSQVTRARDCCLISAPVSRTIPYYHHIIIPVTMDLLSITASLAGVTVPTLKCVQHLRNVLDRIINAPSDIVLVRQDLLIIEQAIISVQNISDQQWESLGKTIVSQLKTGLNLCKESSSKFQAEIDRWTIHSDDGKLCFRDRAMIGLFRQDQIKSISAQLQNCKTTLTLVVSTAIL